MANKRKDDYAAAKGAIATGAGIEGIRNTIPGAVGQRVLYHGTDSSAWNSIKNEGLKASHGGHGGTLGVGRETGVFTDEIANNLGSGKIYASNVKYLAKGFRNQAQLAKEQPQVFRDLFKHRLFMTDRERMNAMQALNDAGKRGKVMHVLVPHDDYLKKFVIDPDVGNATRDTLRQAGLPKNFAETAGKYTAAYTTEDIAPRQILESNAKITDKLKYIASNIKPYYKKYPGRALGYGAGLLGATALTGYGIHKLYSAVQAARNKNLLKTASLAYEFWKENQ